MVKFILLICFSLFFLSCNSNEEQMPEGNKKLIKAIEQLQKNKDSIDYTRPVENKNIIIIKRETELKDIANKIVDYISKNNFDKAFDIIKQYSYIPNKEIDIVLKGTKEQLNLIKNRFGKFKGYEFVKEDKIGKSLIELTYIVKCEHYPLVWKFFFYKAEDNWAIAKYNWNDKIESIK